MAGRVLRFSKNQLGLKHKALLSVAGHILAFPVALKWTSIEKFSLVTNQSICRLIPYLVYYDPLKGGTVPTDAFVPCSSCDGCSLVLFHLLHGMVPNRTGAFQKWRVLPA